MFFPPKTFPPWTVRPHTALSRNPEIQRMFRRSDGRDGGQHSARQKAGAPDARAEAGGSTTGPSAAAPKLLELSGPMGGARTSHYIHLAGPRSGNTAAQPNRVKREKSTGSINSAIAYSEVNVDGSAMAARGLGDHAPVSIELGRNCGRSGPDDCTCSRQSDGAHAIANHGGLICVLYLVNSAPPCLLRPTLARACSPWRVRPTSRQPLWWLNKYQLVIRATAAEVVVGTTFSAG
jgi:hypothetical protein